MRSDAADNRENLADRRTLPAGMRRRRTRRRRLQRFFGLPFGFFRGLPSGNTCSKRLADLLQALLVHVVDALVALGAEVDHLVVVVHGWGYTRRKVRFKRGMQERRVFAT